MKLENPKRAERTTVDTTRARVSARSSFRRVAPRGSVARTTQVLVLASALASLSACSSETTYETVAVAPNVEVPFAPIAQEPLRALPVFGGHGLVVGLTLWVADPERDLIYVHEANGGTIDRIATIVLPRGSTPFRLARVGDTVHATLRGSGSVARLDVNEHVLLGVHEVCADPRGVAADGGRALVACAGGELVATDTNGAIERRVMLEADLRDVVIDARGTTYVSVFIAARVLELDGALAVVRRHEIPREVAPPVMEEELDPHAPITHPGGPLFDFERLPNTAWRMRAAPSGGVDVLHQLSAVSALATPPPPRGTVGDYGSGADSGSAGRPIVAVALTTIDAEGTPSTLRLAGGGFFVDFARTPLGLALAGGATGVNAAGVAFVQEIEPTVYAPSSLMGLGETVPSVEDFAGNAIGLARDTALVVGAATNTPRASTPIADTGHAIFHRTTSVAMACVSCHAEGRDDGLVWDFGRGPRRTQPLTGGILSTGAFHWKGDVRDMAEIMTRTFETQMRGDALQRIEIESLERWLDGLESVGASAEDHAVGRGAELFVTAGCDSCHSGPAGTNGLSAVMDDGERWQVPMLRGAGLRAPYFHDGCASTLRGALDGCEGRAPHPGVETLDDAQLDDLAAFVSTWD